MVRDIQKIPDGNWVLDEAFTVKMMKIGKCPLKSWNQLCLVRAWQCTTSLASLAGQLCQALFMGLGFSLFFLANFYVSRTFVKWQQTHFNCAQIMLLFFREQIAFYFEISESFYFFREWWHYSGVFLLFFGYFVWYSSLSTFLSTVA